MHLLAFRGMAMLTYKRTKKGARRNLKHIFLLAWVIYVLKKNNFTLIKTNRFFLDKNLNELFQCVLKAKYLDVLILKSLKLKGIFISSYIKVGLT